ncbi:helix-turn-helix domain-containing protein [Brevibacillus dissolubilis]|uniref:helix-turn-helix domain-containing protein n=1 Tax=Brevibacillus dissolubilis TaxID=1844116 RepID=UPI00111786D9|nr:tetratricopeptide repeat protein [Brevibacillus dissolubilis]
MSHVGKRLREFRKKMKLTQGELAEGICNRSYVSQIEKGLVIPSPEILEQLAKRLDTDLKNLWSESENPSFSLVEIQNAMRHIINRIDEQEWEIARKWVLKLHGVTLPDSEKGIYYWAKGKLAEADGRIDEVEPLYLYGLESAREQDDPVPLVRLLDSLGSFYCKHNQAQKAIRPLLEALEVVHYNAVSGLLRISVMYHLGVMHQRLGEYQTAIEHLLYAQELNTTNGIMYKSGELELSLAACFQAIGRVDDAITSIQYAIELFQFLQNEADVAVAHAAWGVILSDQGEFQQAQEYFLKAIPVFAQHGRSEEANETSFHLAVLYKRMGRISEARELCEQIILLVHPELTPKALLLLSETALEAEEPDTALPLLKQVLDSFGEEADKELLSHTYRLLARVHMQRHEYEEAARLYEQSLS